MGNRESKIDGPVIVNLKKSLAVLLINHIKKKKRHREQMADMSMKMSGLTICCMREHLPVESANDK